MADHRCVVRKANIFRLIDSTTRSEAIWRGRFLVNNESALNIDFHRSRVGDGTINFGSVRACVNPWRVGGRIASNIIVVSVRRIRRHDVRPKRNRDLKDGLHKTSGADNHGGIKGGADADRNERRFARRNS